MPKKISIRFLVLCLSAILIFGLLAGCGEEAAAKDSLTKEQKQAIEQACGPISWLHALYLGTYDGWIVIFEQTDMPAFDYEEISGFYFRHKSGFWMFAYKDGEVMKLKDAVEEGILSDADMGQIYQRYLEEYWDQDFLQRHEKPPIGE